MKLKVTSGIVLLVLLALGGPAWAGNAKVQVCHIPPGNPSNFHTITISENALQAHMGHGDFAGPCSAHCSQLCNDGNPCTIDACDANEQCVANHPPVNCDDGNRCTVDSCNPASGCSSVPKTCADGNLCTVDSCDPLTGQCVFPASTCPAGQSCDPGNGNCVGNDPCTPNPCVHGACSPPPPPCFAAFNCPPTPANDYICTCDAGWTGANCEIALDSCFGVVCSPDECHANAVCSNGSCSQGTPLPNGTACGRSFPDHCENGFCLIF